MPSVAAASEPDATSLATASRLAVVAAYAALGIALAWSRLFQLGHGFWTDEILMIEGYVREGPRFILTGASINHELMAFLSWGLSSVVGESEVGLRLLSVVPFLAGVVLVTAWLHVRLGAPPPCLGRAGVRHFLFPQSSRGGRIDVWVIPRDDD